MILIHRYNKNR